MAEFGDPRQLQLSEAEARAVLDRALAIQESMGGVSLADLSVAAKEVGISETALAAAVREVLLQRSAHEEAGTDERVSAYHSAWRVALYGVAGAVGGTLLSGPPAVVVLALAAAVGAFRAFDHRRSGSQRQFQLELTALWGGLSLGAAASSTGYLHQDIIGILGTMWISSAAIGGLLISSRGWRRGKEAPAR